MNRQDLDELIDTAARQMVSGKPSRSLKHEVMSRVRGRVQPVGRRFVFATGAVMTAALAAVILMVILNRGGAPVTAPQMERPKIGETRVADEVTSPPANEPVRSRPEGRPVASGPLRPAAQPADATSSMPSLEPLFTEPIVLSALDVPPLETRAVSMEDIEIEDITIEPLVASND